MWLRFPRSITAPLKAEEFPRMRREHGSFPRSSGRGLIEVVASLKLVANDVTTRANPISVILIVAIDVIEVQRAREDVELVSAITRSRSH